MVNYARRDTGSSVLTPYIQGSGVALVSPLSPVNEADAGTLLNRGGGYKENVHAIGHLHELYVNRECCQAIVTLLAAVISDPMAVKNEQAKGVMPTVYASTRVGESLHVQVPSDV